MVTHALPDMNNFINGLETVISLALLWPGLPDDCRCPRVSLSFDDAYKTLLDNADALSLRPDLRLLIDVHVA